MTTFESRDFITLFGAISAAIAADGDRLCALDGAIGDGDHGVSMSTGFAAVVAALKTADAVTPSDVFTVSARSFLNAVGASCGPLYATALLRAAAEIRGLDTIPPDRIADIVAAMARGIADRGKAKIGDKTMLDVWEPAARAMLDAREAGAGLSTQLREAVHVAVEREQATAAMRAGQGRAVRLGDRSIGAIDPGASSARVLIEAIANALIETPTKPKPSIKRSEVNRIMRESDKFIRSFGYIMPPFAYWSPSEFKARKAEAQMIVDRNCGWDITDYGLGEFDKTGLLLFTVRNGNNADLSKGRGMLYAEKAMISRQDQYSPMHRHNLKAEDIINRGGGILVIELFGDTDGKCDRSKGTIVYTDGIHRELPAGHKLKLAPGASVTLMPNEHWHAFWGEGGDVFVGEVSTVNDDNTDNVFEDTRISRFGGIEEDEEPWHLLVSDYAKWLA